MNYFARIDYETGKLGYAYKTLNSVPGNGASFVGIVHVEGADKIEVYYNNGFMDTVYDKSKIILIAKFKDVPVSDLRALEGRCINIPPSVLDKIYELVCIRIKLRSPETIALLKEQFDVFSKEQEVSDYCI